MVYVLSIRWAYTEYRTPFLIIIFCLDVCQRMTPCLKRIHPMPNVPLAYVSVYQCMSDVFHTLAYVSTMRYSVTPPFIPRHWLKWIDCYLAPGGGCEVLSSPGLSVCLSVCVSVYLCVRPIFWYFIYRLLEEISIWNLYRILIGLYSIH